VIIGDTTPLTAAGGGWVPYIIIHHCTLGNSLCLMPTLRNSFTCLVHLRMTIVWIFLIISPSNVFCCCFVFVFFVCVADNTQLPGLWTFQPSTNTWSSQPSPSPSPRYSLTPNTSSLPQTPGSTALSAMVSNGDNLFLLGGNTAPVDDSGMFFFFKNIFKKFIGFFYLFTSIF
jgi:hypothetical protein